MNSYQSKIRHVAVHKGSWRCIQTYINLRRKSMNSFQEQFSAATKATFENQIALMTALTGKAFESVEKVIELNMTVAKAALEESTNNARQLLAAKDPQEFIALTTSQVQPNADKATSYSREVMTIVSGLQAEVTKAAENQIGEHSRKLASL